VYLLHKNVVGSCTSVFQVTFVYMRYLLTILTLTKKFYFTFLCYYHELHAIFLAFVVLESLLNFE